MKHLLPTEAWGQLQQRRDEPLDTAPLFVDVRMEIESLYVGRPPGVVNIPWYEYPDLQPNPARFVRQVKEEAGNTTRTVLLICRSGKRSVEAGQVLETAGFSDVVNILHGFEGELDEHFKRSTLNGWRFAGLPWEQM